MELRDLKIKKGRWLLFCCNNFKKASLLHALQGINVSVLLLLINYFRRYSVFGDGYGDNNENINKWNQDFVSGTVLGIIFFFYSIILLYKIYNNDKDGVFEMIKIGCITLTIVDIAYFLFDFVHNHLEDSSQANNRSSTFSVWAEH